MCLWIAPILTCVVLVDGAAQLCETLAGIGEVGIITNGAHQIQHRRIASSGLQPHLSFVATSEACGFAKPDSRFFEFTSKMARSFAKHETVIVGDRLDADILGANLAGIASAFIAGGVHGEELGVAMGDHPDAEVGPRLYAEYGASPTYLLPELRW